MTCLARILTMGALVCAATCFASNELSYRELLNLKYEVCREGDSQKAFEGAQASFLSDNETVSWTAFEIFQELVEREQYCDEVFEAARIAFTHENEDVQDNAIRFYRALFRRGMGYMEAVDTATAYIREKLQAEELDEYLFDPVEELYDRLVESKKGAPLAEELAPALVMDSDPSVRLSGLMLFQALFDEGIFAQQAYEPAKKAMEDPSPFIRAAGLWLYMDFVLEGKHGSDALKIAQRVAQDDWEWVRFRSFILFYLLIERGVGLEEAVAAAAKGAKDTGKNCRFGSLLLFDGVLQRGQGAEEALLAAKSWKNDRSEEVQGFSLVLFRILREIGYEPQRVASQIEELEARGLDIFDLEELIEDFRE